MSAQSSIEWTDRTWNPVRGCSRVSPGCDNCYAMRVAHRFANQVNGKPGPYQGLTVLRPKTAKRPGVDWSGRVRFVPEALDEPLRWREPQRVFVNSMSDLFHDGLTNEEIAAVFGVMAAAPRHTFQVLTKRPQRAIDWFAWVKEQARGHWHGEHGFLWEALQATAPAVATEKRWLALYESAHGSEPPTALGDAGAGFRWPLPNVWLGVSAEDQRRANERIPILLQCQAAVRFVSAEPLLEALNLHPWLCKHGSADRPEQRFANWCTPSGMLDWIIVGSESGQRARPMDEAWVRSLRDQCSQADVRFFYKQKLEGRKKVGLPMLDGRRWDEFPEAHA